MDISLKRLIRIYRERERWDDIFGGIGSGKRMGQLAEEVGESADTDDTHYSREENISDSNFLCVFSPIN